MIVISGVITVSEHARDELIACLGLLQEKTLEHDAGVVAYRVSVGTKNPNEVHLYEEWESTDALKAHMQKPHMDAFRALREKHNFDTSGFSRWRAEELGQF